MAFEKASSSFSNILKTLSPDLVIYDFSPPWPATIASSFNIPAVQFMTTGATIASFGLHIVRKPGVEFPSWAIKLSGFHDRQSRKGIESWVNKAKNKDDVPVAPQRTCNVILYNTFRELEGKYIDYLSVSGSKKPVPVGPIAHDIVNENEHAETLQWLGKKDESSTVFVSFGSEYFLSKEEMEEAAHGLELSKVNFIWVLRFPVGEKVKIEEALPNGFF